MIHEHRFDFAEFPAGPGPCECGMTFAAFTALFRREDVRG